MSKSPSTLPRIGAARRPLIALALLAALGPRAASAAKFWCGRRQLTAAETARANQVIDAVRKALPPAPAGWSVSADGGSCAPRSRTRPCAGSWRGTSTTRGASGGGSRPGAW
jgi:hypothetical protein